MSAALGIGTSITLFPLTEWAGRKQLAITEEYKKLGEVTLELGKLLCEFEQSGLWVHLFDADNNRWRSFDKWLRGQPELGYSTCRRAMQSYANGTFFDIGEDELAEIDPSKLVALNPLVQKHRKEVDFVDGVLGALQEQGLLSPLASQEAYGAAFVAAKMQVDQLVAMGQNESRSAIETHKGELEGWRSKSYTVSTEQELAEMLDKVRRDFMLGKPIHFTAKQYS